METINSIIRTGCGYARDSFNVALIFANDAVRETASLQVTTKLATAILEFVPSEPISKLHKVTKETSSLLSLTNLAGIGESYKKGSYNPKEYSQCTKNVASLAKDFFTSIDILGKFDLIKVPAFMSAEKYGLPVIRHVINGTTLISGFASLYSNVRTGLNAEKNETRAQRNWTIAADVGKIAVASISTVAAVFDIAKLKSGTTASSAISVAGLAIAWFSNRANSDACAAYMGAAAPKAA